MDKIKLHANNTDCKHVSARRGIMSASRMQVIKVVILTESATQMNLPNQAMGLIVGVKSLDHAGSFVKNNVRL